MMHTITLDRLNQTGAAKDVYGDAFRRNALQALGHRLGTTGALRLADEMVVTGKQLILLAMEDEDTLEKFKNADLQVLAWFADDLVAKLPASVFKTTNQTLHVQGMSITDEVPYGIPLDLFGVMVPVVFTVHTRDGSEETGVQLPTPAVGVAETSNLHKRDALTLVRANALAYLSLPARLKTEPDIVKAAISHSLDSAQLTQLADSFPDSVCADPSLMLALLRAADPEAREALLRKADAELGESRGFASAVFELEFDPALNPSIFASVLTSTVVADAAFLHLFKDAPARFQALVPLWAEYCAIPADNKAELRDFTAKHANEPDLWSMILATQRATEDGDFTFAGSPCPMSRDGSVWLGLVELLGAPRQLWKDLRSLNDVARAGVVNRLTQANIRCLDRFTSLAELDRTLREQNVDDGRPVVLLVESREDHNGAFDDCIADARVNFPLHRIVYREWERFNPDVVDAFAKQAKSPAEVSIIGGHADPLGIAGGVSDITHEVLAELSPEQLATIRAGVKPGGHVIADACSAGRGGPFTANMGNLLSQLVPHASAHTATDVTSGYTVVNPGCANWKIEFVEKQRTHAGYVVPPRK